MLDNTKMGLGWMNLMKYTLQNRQKGGENKTGMRLESMYKRQWVGLNGAGSVTSNRSNY